jgi:hypothetical protein
VQLRLWPRAQTGWTHLSGNGINNACFASGNNFPQTLIVSGPDPDGFASTLLLDRNLKELRNLEIWFF